MVKRLPSDEAGAPPLFLWFVSGGSRFSLDPFFNAYSAKCCSANGVLRRNAKTKMPGAKAGHFTVMISFETAYSWT
ncbi:hypothetical protein [Phyllobacterium phragmitis]|uniref:hypothetical protein n=1 Tax=Phyllobacterium phragmitis TaxID=2670329 RepID=UPI0038B2FDEC